MQENFDLSYAEIRASLQLTAEWENLEPILWPLPATEHEPVYPLGVGGSGGAASASDQPIHAALQAQGVFAERAAQQEMIDDPWLQKLREININEEVLKQLKQQHAIQDYRKLYDNLIRYRAATKGNHSFYSTLNRMQAWELCVLSGELRAIQIAERFFGLRWLPRSRVAEANRSKLGSMLHYAALTGNLTIFRRALVKYELECGVAREPTYYRREDFFNNLLYDMATLGSNIQLLQKCLALFDILILPKKGDQDKLSPDNYHLAHYAALSGDLAMMDYVISLGVNPFQRSKYGVTVLHCAAESGKTAAVEKVLSWLAEPENYLSQEVLKRFFSSDNLASLTQEQKIRGRGHLLSTWNYEPPKTRTHNGRSVLHYAARSGAVDTMRQVIALGIDPNQVDDFGMTPDFSAIYGANPASLDFLAAAGLNLKETKDNEDNTPLHTAVFLGLSRMTYELIAKYGLDPSLKDSGGEDSYAVARRGWGNCLAVIIKAVAMQRKNPLLKMRLFLLYKEADIFSDLVKIIQSGTDIEFKKYFNAYCIDINVQDVAGTLAHHAALQGRADVLEFLRAKGVDMEIKNFQGKTADELLEDYLQAQSAVNAGPSP